MKSSGVGYIRIFFPKAAHKKGRKIITPPTISFLKRKVAALIFFQNRRMA
jgi:hypothetical protein